MNYDDLRHCYTILRKAEDHCSDLHRDALDIGVRARVREIRREIFEVRQMVEATMKSPGLGPHAIEKP